MSRWCLHDRGDLIIERGDVTRSQVDAIVNAANPMMLGGGGVDGAIHRAAGPKLLEACRRVPSVDGIRCPTGQARITPGFDLPARFVIHTVGPVYRRSVDPAGLLAAAHRNSLALAVAHDLHSIAFPAISCGAYGYPLDEAARIAIQTCLAQRPPLREIRFVLYGHATLDAWMHAGSELLGTALA